MSLPPEVANLLELFDGEPTSGIRGLAGAGDIAVGPGITVAAIAFALADLDESAGELIEQVGLLDEITAGLGERGEAIHRLFQFAVGGLLYLPYILLLRYRIPEGTNVRRECGSCVIEFLEHLGMGAVYRQGLQEGLHCFSQCGERGDERRQQLDLFTVIILGEKTARALIEHAVAVTGHEVEVLLSAAAIEPDDGKDVLFLLRAEVVDLPRDLAVDVPRIDHQHLVAILLGLIPVEEPQLAGDGAGVEEV